jgi:hypothetical protein
MGGFARVRQSARAPTPETRSFDFGSSDQLALFGCERSLLVDRSPSRQRNGHRRSPARHGWLVVTVPQRIGELRRVLRPGESLRGEG